MSGASILPHCVRVEVPTDAERLLTAGGNEGAQWRGGLRRAVQWAMGAGYSVSGFYADDGAECGYYLFTKGARSPQPTLRL